MRHILTLRPEGREVFVALYHSSAESWAKPSETCGRHNVDSYFRRLSPHHCNRPAPLEIRDLDGKMGGNSFLCSDCFISLFGEEALLLHYGDCLLFDFLFKAYPRNQSYIFALGVADREQLKHWGAGCEEPNCQQVGVWTNKEGAAPNKCTRHSIAVINSKEWEEATLALAPHYPEDVPWLFELRDKLRQAWPDVFPCLEVIRRPFPTRDYFDSPHWDPLMDQEFLRKASPEYQELIRLSREAYLHSSTPEVVAELRRACILQGLITE